MFILRKIHQCLISVSLQTKIIGMVIGLSLSMGSALSFQVSRYLNEHANAFIKEESRSVAAEIVNKVPDYTLINDLYGLTGYLLNTKDNRRDIRYIAVLDNTGNILAHTFGSQFPTELYKHLRQVARHHQKTQTIQTDEGMIWETISPVTQSWNGSVAVGVVDSFVRLDNKKMIEALFMTTSLVGAIGIFFAVGLSWVIVRPIKELLRATNAIRQGEFPVMPELQSPDEVGELTQAFNEMSAGFQLAEEARKEKENIRREFLQKIITSQENERKRIARELHDQTGQSLTSIGIGLKLLERNATSEKTKQDIRQLKINIENELEAIHNMALELRPSVLDDMGLIAALNLFIQKIHTIKDVDIQQTIIGFAGRRPSAVIETCLYRILQESIRNAIKHGRACHISILIEWAADNTLRMVIDDDGDGFDPGILQNTERLGVRGIQERVELVNGVFRLESEPGQGTMLVVTIPTVSGGKNGG
ncbi:histidine kinase [Desulfomarina profundi]|uniref:histidine kinase n=1 Tax=Desulfomarina profundi TaxID=2772557 RepID=A0A8D5FU42_9BACT|nr:ATP-binding protein [Desulfomarina profundi]BCL61406.1 histidine kinase [Desulfomarina profundi]